MNLKLWRRGGKDGMVRETTSDVMINKKFITFRTEKLPTKEDVEFRMSTVYYSNLLLRPQGWGVTLW